MQLVLNSNRGRQGQQPGGQAGLQLTHLDPNARQQLTAKITTLCFSAFTFTAFLSVLSLEKRQGRGMGRMTPLTSDESTVLCSLCCHVKMQENTGLWFGVQTDPIHSRLSPHQPPPHPTSFDNDAAHRKLVTPGR